MPKKRGSEIRPGDEIKRGRYYSEVSSIIDHRPNAPTIIVRTVGMKDYRIGRESMVQVREKPQPKVTMTVERVFLGRHSETDETPTWYAHGLIRGLDGFRFAMLSQAQAQRLLKVLRIEGVVSANVEFPQDRVR